MVARPGQGQTLALAERVRIWYPEARSDVPLVGRASTDFLEVGSKRRGWQNMCGGVRNRGARGALPKWQAWLDRPTRASICELLTLAFAHQHHTSAPPGTMVKQLQKPSPGDRFSTCQQESHHPR